MAKFHYSGKDKNNVLKKGIIDASSRQDAALALEKNGISPFLISEQKSYKEALGRLFSFDHLSISDKMMFCEEISTLINSGVPLSQSIRIIRDQAEKGTMKKIADSLLRGVEGGQSLSGALERESKYFSPVFINMVRAGEAGGTLDKALSDLAVQTQKDAELIAKIKGAMTYPAVIVAAMVAAGIFLLVNVIPKISDFFS